MQQNTVATFKIYHCVILSIEFSHSFMQQYLINIVKLKRPCDRIMDSLVTCNQVSQCYNKTVIFQFQNSNAHYFLFIYLLIILKCLCNTLNRCKLGTHGDRYLT